MSTTLGQTCIKYSEQKNGSRSLHPLIGGYRTCTYKKRHTECAIYSLICETVNNVGYDNGLVYTSTL